MKKIHKIAISVILAMAAILFIVVAAWQPCPYAFIVPAVLAIVGFSYLATVYFANRNQKRNKAIAVNA